MSDNLVENLIYLKNLYIKAIALLENYDREKKSYIGPHNELRNAFDHIMRMIEKKDVEVSFYEEFRGAESHLLRAGYDAYELICINHINYIKNVLGSYSPNDISIGFSDYYSIIRPNIVDIEKETAKIREVKRQEKETQKSVVESTLGNDTFTYYFEAANKLENYMKEIDRHIISIRDAYNDRIKKKKMTIKKKICKLKK